MRYQIVISPIVQKQLSAITDRRVQQGLIHTIEGLEADSEKKGKPLTGKLVGCRSVRAVAQRYRIIFQVDVGAGQVVILTVGLRKEGDRTDVYAVAERLVRAGLLTLLVLFFLLIDMR